MWTVYLVCNKLSQELVVHPSPLSLNAVLEVNCDGIKQSKMMDEEY